MYDGYQALANSVVSLACSDWLNAKIEIYLGSKDARIDFTVEDCERFFRSEYCFILTSTEASEILASLEKRLERNIAFLKYLDGIRTPLANWQRKYREKLGDDSQILRRIATTYHGLPVEARKRAKQMIQDKGYKFDYTQYEFKGD